MSSGGIAVSQNFVFVFLSCSDTLITYPILISSGGMVDGLQLCLCLSQVIFPLKAANYLISISSGGMIDDHLTELCLSLSQFMSANHLI